VKVRGVRDWQSIRHDWWDAIFRLARETSDVENLDRWQVRVQDDKVSISLYISMCYKRLYLMNNEKVCSACYSKHIHTQNWNIIKLKCGRHWRSPLHVRWKTSYGWADSRSLPRRLLTFFKIQYGGRRNLGFSWLARSAIIAACLLTVCQICLRYLV